MERRTVVDAGISAPRDGGSDGGAEEDEWPMAAMLGSRSSRSRSCRSSALLGSSRAEARRALWVARWAVRLVAPWAVRLVAPWAAWFVVQPLLPERMSIQAGRAVALFAAYKSIIPRMRYGMAVDMAYGLFLDWFYRRIVDTCVLTEG